ncbi:hypothetical protein STRIP9103_07291 [Streptomyces ipomoeae 91-03]|uniref:Uncharacterized protein n=1 Tax=Streptomyces ipomoeae 91-03 TaxID=698759 RepID=L1L3P6_9ACTN|nr:hypothetical protein STRIP9103_07291 [Streptomyces ipomoeae 91-03]
MSNTAPLLLMRHQKACGVGHLSTTGPYEADRPDVVVATGLRRGHRERGYME